MVRFDSGKSPSHFAASLVMLYLFAGGCSSAAEDDAPVIIRGEDAAETADAGSPENPDGSADDASVAGDGEMSSVKNDAESSEQDASDCTGPCEPTGVVLENLEARVQEIDDVYSCPGCVDGEYILSFSVTNHGEQRVSRLTAVELDLPGSRVTGGGYQCGGAWDVPPGENSGLVEIPVRFSDSNCYISGEVPCDASSSETFRRDYEPCRDNADAPTSGDVRLELRGLFEDGSNWTATGAGEIVDNR